MQNQFRSDKIYMDDGAVPHDTGRVIKPPFLARKTGLDLPPSLP